MTRIDVRYTTMAKTSELIAALAEATGLRSAEVKIFARSLREAGRFPRQTKAPESWNISSIEAARLTAVVLAGGVSSRAAETLENLESFRQENVNRKDRFPKTGWHGALCKGLSNRAGFVEAIDFLISAYALLPSGLSSDDILLCVIYTNSGRAVIRAFLRDQPDAECFAGYSSNKEALPGDLTSERMITGRTIAAVARVLRESEAAEGE